MTYLKQTKVHSEHVDGDCWATCIACLLSLGGVPQIDVRKEVDNEWRESHNFCRSYGYDFIEMQPQVVGMTIPEGMLVIATGKSPRQPRLKKDDEKDICHCVIGKTRIDKVDKDKQRLVIEFVHDPHPDNTFIEDLQWITFLIPKVTT